MHKAKPHNHKEWKPIDLRKFLFDVSTCLSMHTDSGGRGKKLSRVVKGV